MAYNYDEFNGQSLVFKYNVDNNGNPITVKIENENKQVSTHGTIQLEHVPDEFNRVLMLDDKNKEMVEVFNKDEITPTTYYIDYNNGVAYLDKTQFGKTKIYNYYSRGLQLIGCSRIFDEHDVRGQNVLLTLQEIIDAGKECIRILLNIGDAWQIIQRLERDIAEGRQLILDIEGKIIEARADVDGMLVELEDKKTDCIRQIDEAVQNGMDNIVNVAGNIEIQIPSSAWVLNNGSYEKQITHNLNSEKLHVSAINSDTKEAITIGYKVVDKSNVILKSDENINANIILSASYYNPYLYGNGEIAEEVVAARKGETSLDVKIGKIDTAIAEHSASLETKVFYCDTIANLKNSNFKIGSNIQTLGYHSKNDGGGANYNIISNNENITTDSGKYIILNNGLIASLIDNNVNNIRQFGAKGDGVSDDIQAFKNYANWGGMLGKHLNLSWGVFFINDEFILENNTMFGGGFHRTTIKIGKNGKVTVKGLRNKIENITLEGISIADKSPVGLNIDGATHSVFRDLEIHQFVIGVNINENSWSNEFQKVIMYHNDICLETRGREINNTSFIDCHAVSSRVGFNMISPDDGFHYKINFIGCQFELNDDVGLYIQANGTYSINGCYFERNNTSFRTDYNKGGLVVSYPNIYGPRPATLDIIGCYHIASNVRLKQTNSSTTTLISNYFKDIAKFGIEILNSGVSNNKVLNINPTYETVQVNVSDNDRVYTLNPLNMYVTTSERPTNPTSGQSVFDVSIGKPIWWNGYDWKDANGTTV